MKIEAELISFPDPYSDPPPSIRCTSNVLIHDSIYIKFNVGDEKFVYQFEGNIGGIDYLEKHPIFNNFIIVSNGKGYLFDPVARNVILNFGGNIICRYPVNF